MNKALQILKNCRDRGQKRAGGLDLREAIAELEAAMKPKTCEGCQWEQETNLIRTKVGDKVDICTLCTRYENLQDNYEPKVTP